MAEFSIGADKVTTLYCNSILNSFNEVYTPIDHEIYLISNDNGVVVNFRFPGEEIISQAIVSQSKYTISDYPLERGNVLNGSINRIDLTIDFTGMYFDIGGVIKMKGKCQIMPEPRI